MQSAKKHRRPKRERVDASKFAAHYASSVGSYDEAILKAENMRKIADDHSAKPELNVADAREAKRTANFWGNVVGVLKKQQLKMTGGTKARA